MMKKSSLSSLSALLLCLFLISFSSASAEKTPLSAKDIVRASDALMRGDTNQGLYEMRIETARWNRRLKLHVFSEGKDLIFIRILEPAKEAGIGTLRIKNEMWNYLPRVEKIIKIPPSMMLQPWMGSDFANDDLVKENSIVDDYTHTIKDKTLIGEESVYIIELIPKSDAAVIWGRLLLWIRAADSIPLKQEYYDERQRLVKRLTYSDIGPVSGRIIPRTWTMTNLLKEQKQTIIRLLDVAYNQPISDDTFTLQNLKRAP